MWLLPLALGAPWTILKDRDMHMYSYCHKVGLPAYVIMYLLGCSAWPSHTRVCSSFVAVSCCQHAILFALICLCIPTSHQKHCGHLGKALIVRSLFSKAKCTYASCGQGFFSHVWPCWQAMSCSLMFCCSNARLAWQAASDMPDRL